MVLVATAFATLLALIFSFGAAADLVRLHRRLGGLEDRWRTYRTKAALWDILQDAEATEGHLQLPGMDIPEQRGQSL